MNGRRRGTRGLWGGGCARVMVGCGAAQAPHGREVLRAHGAVVEAREAGAREVETREAETREAETRSDVGAERAVQGTSPEAGAGAVSTKATPTAAQGAMVTVGDAPVEREVTVGSAETAGAAAESLRFTTVAHVDAAHDLRVHPIEGAVLVSTYDVPSAREVAAGGAGKPYQGISIGVLEGGKLDFPERLRMAGCCSRVFTVVGRWPDQVDALVTGYTARASLGEHWSLGALGFRRRDADLGRFYTGVAQVGASLVGLTGPNVFEVSRLVTLRGPLTKLRLASVPKGAGALRDQSPVDPTDLRPEAFGATRDGTVVSYGARYAGDRALEVWARGEERSTFVPLPGLRWGKLPDDARTQVLRGAAEREAYLYSNRFGLELAYSLDQNEFRGEQVTELTVADVRAPETGTAL